jgi:hypothetical protein
MSSWQRCLVWAVVLIALTALVGSCGSADDDSANADIDPAKASYIEEADATCTEQSAEIRRLIAPYTNNGDYADLTEPQASEMVKEALAPAMGFEIRSVRAIVLPQKYVSEVLRFLEVWQQVVDQAEKNPLAFVREQNPFAKPERLARDFGFEVCGSL